jgi:hypothetical protein
MFFLRYGEIGTTVCPEYDKRQERRKKNLFSLREGMLD